MNDNMMMEIKKKASILDILEECLFSTAGLGYKGDELYINSGDVETLLRSIFPDRYAKRLAVLQAEAERKRTEAERRDPD